MHFHYCFDLHYASFILNGVNGKRRLILSNRKSPFRLNILIEHSLTKMFHLLIVSCKHNGTPKEYKKRKIWIISESILDKF